MEMIGHWRGLLEGNLKMKRALVLIGLDWIGLDWQQWNKGELLIVINF
jgi:hypothetical protein